MQAAPKPCSQCGVIVRDGTGRCEVHKHVGRWGDKRRGSRHERGYGTEWDKTRARILARDAGICQPCLQLGLTHQGTEVDHILPKAQGGDDSDDNLQTICTQAHREKTQREARQARPCAFPAPALAPGLTPGGESNPAAPAHRTVRYPSFLRAQVSGEGGVTPGQGDGASATAAAGAA